MSRIFRAHLHIPGHPAPKGSRIPGVRKNGSIYTRPASKREKGWVEAVALVARANRPRGEPLEPPYEIELAFACPKPRKPTYRWPSKDGDLDKLARAVIDGLVDGGLILDDRHVTRLTASKSFAASGQSGVGVAII